MFMKYSLLLAVVPFIAAQSTPPACALTCLLSNIGTSGCSGPTDLTCLCTSAPFQSAVGSCLQTGCTAQSDIEAALAYSQQSCASVGITLSTTPLSGASTAASTAASSSAASSSAASSSSMMTSSSAASSSSASSSAASSSAPTSTGAVASATSSLASAASGAVSSAAPTGAANAAFSYNAVLGGLAAVAGGAALLL